MVWDFTKAHPAQKCCHDKTNEHAWTSSVKRPSEVVSTVTTTAGKNPGQFLAWILLFIDPWPLYVFFVSDASRAESHRGSKRNAE